MQRFFVSYPLGKDLEITETGFFHQLTRVLRSHIWDQIVLFGGDGSEHSYEIVWIWKKSVDITWLKQSFSNTENKKRVTLYQALPNKLEKIEYIIQKWVEVGIQKFVFFRSDRSQKLMLSEIKKTRIRLIAQEAVEQCGGLHMPDIFFLESIKERDIQKDWSRHIVLDIVDIPSRFSDFETFPVIALWVGPEWGWSETERVKLKEYGFIFVRFGERVLRTETAGSVMAFALLNQ